jgi:hypothetical protein
MILVPYSVLSAKVVFVFLYQIHSSVMACEELPPLDDPLLSSSRGPDGERTAHHRLPDDGPARTPSLPRSCRTDRSRVAAERETKLHSCNPV